MDLSILYSRSLRLKRAESTIRGLVLLRLTPPSPVQCHRRLKHLDRQIGFDPGRFGRSDRKAGVAFVDGLHRLVGRRSGLREGVAGGLVDGDVAPDFYPA